MGSFEEAEKKLRELTKRENRNGIVIIDISIPFWSMVTLIFKFAIALIPAVIALVTLNAWLVSLLVGR